MKSRLKRIRTEISPVILLANNARYEIGYIMAGCKMTGAKIISGKVSLGDVPWSELTGEEVRVLLDNIREGSYVDLLPTEDELLEITMRDRVHKLYSLMADSLKTCT